LQAAAHSQHSYAFAIADPCSGWYSFYDRVGMLLEYV
jgi:hypothetical protein